MKSLLFAAIAVFPGMVKDPAPAPVAKPAPAPVYDEAADGRAQLEAAFARAKRDNQRVLVQWGANWCGWCKKLAETCKSDESLARELLYEYVTVKIDVGRFEKHVDLAQKYGAKIEGGIPYLTVLDAEGRVLSNQETGEFEVEGRHDPAKVLAFLKTHEARPLDATKQLDAALVRARSEGKRVFLHFGAPWCGWCHRLEDWLARPEIGERLGKDFIELKIDVDRMIGAKEAVARFPRSEKQGIPWFAFLDAEAKVLADSTGPKGNVGFPAAPEELAHFRTMLDAARGRMSAEDVSFLLRSLEPPKKD